MIGYDHMNKIGFRGSTLAITAFIAAIGFITVYPLVMLFCGSFASPKGGGLHSYVETFTNAVVLKTLWTTIWLSAVRVILSVGLAIFLAWVVTRTNALFKRTIEFLIWMAFFLPTLPMVLSWMILGLPRTGLINQLWMKVFHVSTPLMNIQSYGGIIWVSVLPWSAVLFLLITPAFANMDSSLEEASTMSGAKGFTTIRRITTPVLTPAILAVSMLAFILMMQSFEVELLLGSPANIYVFSTRIYDYINAEPPNFAMATSFSTVFTLIVFCVMFYQWRVLVRKERYVTVTGRGFSVRPLDLGRWKYAVASVILVYLVLATIVPLVALILGSFMKIPGYYGMPQPFTLNYYPKVLANPVVWETFKNTVLVAGGAATIGMFFYAVISYIIVRTRFRGRSALEFVSWLPYTVPTLVLGLGFLWAYVGGIRLPFAAYGTVQLLIFAFIVRGMPMAVRSMNGSMIQLGAELEESSRVHGASWCYTFQHIVMPLIRPAFLAVWILLFNIGARDLGTIVLLYGPNSRVASTLLLEYWNTGLNAEATIIGVLTVLLIVIVVLVAHFVGARGEAVA